MSDRFGLVIFASGRGLRPRDSTVGEERDPFGIGRQLGVRVLTSAGEQYRSGSVPNEPKIVTKFILGPIRASRADNDRVAIWRYSNAADANVIEILIKRKFRF